MKLPVQKRNDPADDKGPAPSQLESMTTTHALPMECLKLLSLRDVAEALRVAPATIERMVARRVLPVYRVARKLLFRQEDIANWLERQRTDSIERS